MPLLKNVIYKNGRKYIGSVEGYAHLSPNLTLVTLKIQREYKVLWFKFRGLIDFIDVALNPNNITVLVIEKAIVDFVKGLK